MAVRLTDLRAEHLTEPLAVPSPTPTFSWAIESDERDVRQRAARVRVTAAGDGDRVVWDSGVDATDRTFAIVFGGDALEPLARYHWTAESHLEDGRTVSQSSWFETGPHPDEWDTAEWITVARPPTAPVDLHPAPYLRTGFSLGERIVSARLYATAGGIFEAWINGARVSDADFAPGWTDYRFRVPYHAFDVTTLLRNGTNTLGAILGEGWYSGYYGPFGKRAYWGDVPVFRALLAVTYADGTRRVIRTDRAWEGAHGDILLAEILHGETVDRRRELTGWSAGAPDRRWHPVSAMAGPAGQLVPARIPAAGPVREVEPVAITEPLEGTYIVDFGQNFAGRVRIRAEGPAGTTITLRHAEILDPEGGLYTENLRTARSTDTVVLRGDGVEEFEPRFTFHGFRYAEISGYPGTPALDDITGVVVSSLRGLDLELETGDELVDALQRNLQWTMLSNYLEVPTDCPNRDERLGWGGDAHVFAPTGMMNADLQAFYLKWLDDIADAQKPNGAFADIAPGVIVDFAEVGAAGYADAGVFLPWQLWEHYGDPGVLAEFVDRGERWLDYVLSTNPDHVWRKDRNADYGDWIATVATDKVLVATAYWARAAAVVASGARVLGRSRQAERCEALFDLIASAFRSEFLGPDGVLREATQTADVLAIEFGLLGPDETRRAGDRLAADVEERGHLTVGFLGIRHALAALCTAGRPDLAFRVLLRTEAPSWGDQLAHGLTTIGEHWSAWGPDGELLDPWMNSFNHFALGAVGEWLYREVGGIRAVQPGFGRIAFAPRIDGPLRHSRLRLVSPRGPVVCDWDARGERFRMLVEVPANSSAVVRLPRGAVSESGRPLGEVVGVGAVTESADGIELEVSSGAYEFEVERGVRA